MEHLNDSNSKASLEERWFLHISGVFIEYVINNLEHIKLNFSRDELNRFERFVEATKGKKRAFTIEELDLTISGINALAGLNLNELNLDKWNKMPQEQKPTSLAIPVFIKEGRIILNCEAKNIEKTYCVSILESFRYILPKRFREEFAGDVREIYFSLLEEGHHKIWIYLILSLNLINVCWSAIRFKYDAYFKIEKSAKE